MVKKNETLGRIAADSGVTVREIQKLNGIFDPNRIREGQVLRIHEAGYLWRRPPIELVGSYLSQALNMKPAAAPAIVEHKRSHIVLPDGNVAQQHANEKKIVVVRGGATSEQLTSRRKNKDILHRTAEKDIKKKVAAPSAEFGKALREGLLFPLKFRSPLTYHTGPRRFHSGRSAGRLHGGCDLYAPVGTPVHAMDAGEVLNVYPFYWQTFAVEVKHGNFIVRYGEVEPMSMAERKALVGKLVQRGDVIGKVGQLIQPGGKPYKYTMLHLEMYSTNESPKSSPLTNNTAPFRRRADLVDPTPTLDKCLDQ